MVTPNLSAVRNLLRRVVPLSAGGPVPAVVCAAIGLGTASCTVAVGEFTDDEVASTEQELAINVAVVRWSNTVPICFRNNGGYCRNRCSDNAQECDPNNAASCNAGATCSTNTRCQDNATQCSLDSACDGLAWNNVSPPHPANTTVPNYSARKLDVQSAIDDAWAAPSGLNFTYQGDCVSNPPSTTMVVNLRNYTPQGATDDSSGFCGLGEGARCEFHANVTPVTGVKDFRWAAAHEIGHGLGLPHEHQRADVQCPATMAIVQNCQACTDGGCNEANLNLCTCSQTEFTACFQVAAPAPPITLTLDQFKTARGRISDSSPHPNFVGLTAYDPSSVMNYCGPRPEPATSLDRLGIELLYPNGTNLPVSCSSGCWSAGSTLTLRSNGSLQDDWMARGALGWWTSAPTWKKNGTTIGTGPTLSATTLGTSSTVSFSATNKWSNHSMVGSRSAVIDNAKWTALRVPALTLL